MKTQLVKGVWGIVAVYCENQDINTFCGQNAPVLDVNSDGVYS
jgi:hypothetical protein